MTRRVLMLMAAALGGYERRVNFKQVERLSRSAQDVIDVFFLSGRFARLDGQYALDIWAAAAKDPRFAGGNRTLVNLEHVEQITKFAPGTVDVIFASGRDPRLQGDDANAVWSAATTGRF